MDTSKFEYGHLFLRSFSTYQISQPYSMHSITETESVRGPHHVHYAHMQALLLSRAKFYLGARRGRCACACGPQLIRTFCHPPENK